MAGRRLSAEEARRLGLDDGPGVEVLGELPEELQPKAPALRPEAQNVITEDDPWWLTKGAKRPEPQREYPHADPDEVLAQHRAPKETTKREAALRHAANAYFPFVDEVAGAVRAAAETKDIRKLPENYRRARDDERARLEQTDREHPVTAAGARGFGLLGSVLTPGLGPMKGAGFAKNVGKAAGVGGAYAAGESEADLTRGEVARFAKDVAGGAVAAATVYAGGEAGKKGIKWATGRVADRLEQRIANEIAEGEAKTTPTQRQKLYKASKPITNEVISGPDAKAVRKAYLAGGQEGRELLAPIIDSVGAKLDDGYARFEAKGKHTVPLKAYTSQIEAKRQAALADGKLELADALWEHMKDASRLADELGGKLDLRSLRGLTTQTQRAAASAIGGLNQHASAVLKNQLGAAASEAMAASLGKNAGKDPDLIRALAQIQQNNPRMHALLTIDDVLKLRAYKEATAPSRFVRAADAVSKPAAIAGGIYGAQGAFDSIQSGDYGEVGKRLGVGVALAALARGIPRGARWVDRRVTSGAITAAQGRMPIRAAAAERAVEVGGRVAARSATTQREQEERKRGRRLSDEEARDLGLDDE